MKQYTNESQTTKLIELGLPRPKYILDVWAHETDIDMEYEYEYAYSIGELIEMLPPSAKIKGYDCFLYIEPQHYDGGWDVGYMRYNVELNHRATELVDALYAVILQLKEKGVI